MKITSFLFSKGGHKFWSHYHDSCKDRLQTRAANRRCDSWLEAADAVIADYHIWRY